MSDKKDEIIVNVSKELASLSVGFVIDGGNSVTKLLYRSKEDYDHGKPRDTSQKFGKLRIRNFGHDDIDDCIEFLKMNCDRITDAKDVNDGKDLITSIVWFQLGMTFQNWKSKLEETLNIRSTVLSESFAMLSALGTFYMTPTTCESHQQVLPMSESAVAQGRNMVRLAVVTGEHFRKNGEKAIGAMANRPRTGYDLDKYNTDLMAKSPTELVNDLQLVDIKYPIIFVILGSLAQVYMINEDESAVMIDCLKTSSRTFYNVGTTLTGAKSFNELADMVGRGNTHKVDEHASDISLQRKDWFAAIENDAMLNSAGKLGQEKYKDLYTKDDIAASLSLSFCSTTCKIIILHARMNDIQSVVFCGSVLSHPAIRAHLDEAFAEGSLFQPYCGGEVLKMAVLSNPGFTCALGAWQLNWELERAERQKNK